MTKPLEPVAPAITRAGSRCRFFRVTQAAACGTHFLDLAIEDEATP